MTNEPLKQSQQGDIDISPQEVELLDDIAEVVFQGVMLKVMDALPDDKQDELSALFDVSNLDPENDEKRNAIYTFLSGQVPNFEGLVQAELDAFKAEEVKVYEEIEQAEGKV